MSRSRCWWWRLWWYGVVMHLNIMCRGIENRISKNRRPQRQKRGRDSNVSWIEFLMFGCASANDGCTGIPTSASQCRGHMWCSKRLTVYCHNYCDFVHVCRILLWFLCLILFELVRCRRQSVYASPSHVNSISNWTHLGLLWLSLLQNENLISLHPPSHAASRRHVHSFACSASAPYFPLFLTKMTINIRPFHCLTVSSLYALKLKYIVFGCI